MALIGGVVPAAVREGSIGSAWPRRAEPDEREPGDELVGGGAAAAIDRLVHHSVILEFAVPSYRTERAGKPSESPPDPAPGSKANKKGK